MFKSKDLEMLNISRKTLALFLSFIFINLIGTTEPIQSVNSQNTQDEGIGYIELSQNPLSSKAIFSLSLNPCWQEANPDGILTAWFDIDRKGLVLSLKGGGSEKCSEIAEIRVIDDSSGYYKVFQVLHEGGIIILDAELE